MPSHKLKHTVLWIVIAFAVAAAIGVALLAYGISKAGYWLQAPGRPPEKANAIVVLGGDDGERSLRAQALYHEGYAPIIVLTGLERGNAAPPARLTWRADFLAANGVPRSALRFEVRSRNSYEEATQILALMQKQKWRSVIIVSDPPHMRRLAWTWARVFKDSDLHYVLVASEPEWWSPADWWKYEQSGAFVIMECIKLAYYMVKR
jgi:uncharacterized SAM-binding protein YcdF (DUF218 family)